jgi:acetyltransferase-like isoleucine patch superfamily enzyme
MRSEGKSSPPKCGLQTHFTTYVHRAKGLRLPRGVVVPPGVEIGHPRKIVIERHVELRRNSTIDAISELDPSIVLGAGTRIKENVWIAAYGGFVRIGLNVLIGRNCVLHGHGGITLADEVMLGPNVVITTATHGMSVSEEGSVSASFQFQKETATPVEVGRGSWIGSGCQVLGGTIIEQNVVLGAGSVARGRLAAGFLYAGCPARKVRSL